MSTSPRKGPRVDRATVGSLDGGCQPDCARTGRSPGANVEPRSTPVQLSLDETPEATKGSNKGVGSLYLNSSEAWYGPLPGLKKEPAGLKISRLFLFRSGACRRAARPCSLHPSPSGTPSVARGRAPARRHPPRKSLAPCGRGLGEGCSGRQRPKEGNSPVAIRWRMATGC
jgi:hypothetical protein